MTTRRVLTDFHIDNISARINKRRATPKELEFARAVISELVDSTEFQSIQADSAKLSMILTSITELDKNGALPYELEAFLEKETTK